MNQNRPPGPPYPQQPQYPQQQQQWAQPARPPQQQNQLVPTHCQMCRRQVPVLPVTYRQNIGLLVLRLPKRLDGYLCRTCSAQVFWRMTTISFFFGWWGIISFFFNWGVLFGNLATYSRTQKLPAS